jgi:hypothetical protein
MVPCSEITTTVVRIGSYSELYVVQACSSTRVQTTRKTTLQLQQ